jgi:phosphohistidine phosphatase
MKRIVLVRHATAVDTGFKGSDFHRRLKKRGRREAAIMADRAWSVAGAPDLMVSSPADRAIETARAFADRFGWPHNRIVVREELYGGLLPDDFQRIVNGFDDAAANAMLFGHDPSFSEFAAFLVPGFAHVIPKAGVVVIEVPRKSWRGVRRGSGKLAAFERPPASADQKRVEEELLDALARRIRTAVFVALREMGIAENREVVKAAARAGVRLAAAVRPFVEPSRVLGGRRSRAGSSRRAGAQAGKVRAPGAGRRPARGRKS